MINLQHVITYAAFNSNVVPSYNVDDIPGEVMSIGRDMLQYEILPQMNVDRTLDVALKSDIFQPTGNKLTFIQDPDWVSVLDMPNQTLNTVNVPEKFNKPPVVEGVFPFSLNQVVSEFSPNSVDGWNDNTVLDIESNKIGTWVSNYLRTPIRNGGANRFIQYLNIDFNSILNGYQFVNLDKQPLLLATTDGYLIMVLLWMMRGQPNEIRLKSFGTNLRWLPYYIDSVLDHPTGLPYTYLNVNQFHNADYKFNLRIYTQTNTDRSLELEFSDNGLKRISYPVPIVMQGDYIIAQLKFEKFITDRLAEEFATHYQMSTMATMKENAIQSYGTVKRHTPNVIQPADPRINIRTTLQRGWNWRFNNGR